MLPDHVGLTKDQDSDVDDVSWENHGFVEMWGKRRGQTLSTTESVKGLIDFPVANSL